MENIVVDWPIFEMSCVEEQDGEHRCVLASLHAPLPYVVSCRLLLTMAE